MGTFTFDGVSADYSHMEQIEDWREYSTLWKNMSICLYLMINDEQVLYYLCTSFLGSNLDAK